MFILCIGSILIIDYNSNKKNLKHSFTTEMQNKYSQVIEHINNASLRSLDLSVWIANTESIQAAFMEKDRKLLQELTLPVYQKVKKEINLDKFQFHLPPATSFLRLHKPNKFGDDLTGIRPTIVAVNSTKKNITGLDKGRFGFGIRGLSPVFINETHIGSVEFGISLNDTFLDQLQQLYQINVAIMTQDQTDIFKVLAKNYSFSNPEENLGIYTDIIKNGGFRHVQRNISGKDVFYFIGPLKDFSGKIEGVIIIEKDISIHIAKMKKILTIYLTIGLISLLLIITVMYFIFNRLLNKRIQRFSKVLRKASKGDLTIRSRVLKPDEMGLLGEMLNIYLSTNQKAITELKEDSKILKDASIGLHSISTTMNERAKDLSKNTECMEQSSSETNNNVNSIAAAIEQTSTNVEQISKNVDFLSQSLQEISKVTSSASKVSGHATKNAQEVSVKMGQLENIVKDISKVTETINDISEQTNLLALNATIEAARAGDAGKGFAVVAGEIKVLASQTGDATKNIKQKIENIQQSTQDSLKGIKEISDVISDVDGIVNEISKNVDEQSQNTVEISQNAEQATLGMKEVYESAAIITTQTQTAVETISDMNKETSDVENESKKINENSSKIDAISKTLETLIGKFTV
jgi:methyl-accepting chemotaxis protein